MMLLKGCILLAVCCLTVSCVRPRRKNHCRDNMLNIADGLYPCKLLTDQHHPQQNILGAYNNRVNLCSKRGHSGCCRTCRDNKLVVRRKIRHRVVNPMNKKQTQRQDNGSCRDGMLNIADGKYSCLMLIDRGHWDQKRVGAYNQRAVLCSKPGYSGCCKTCVKHNMFVTDISKKEQQIDPSMTLPVQTVDGIHLDDTCKDSGLNIAGGIYDCAMLVDQNNSKQAYLGVYGSRKELCNQPNQSGCCRTCTIHGHYKSKPKPKRPQPHIDTDHTKEQSPPSYCQDSGLRIADGSYDCAMLIDKNYKNQAVIGAYSYRRKLCYRRMFSGCCHTCQRHVISRNKRVCKDEYVVVMKNKSTYACRDLLHRKSDIYPDRFDLCADTVNTRCCKACKKVSKTKNAKGLIQNINLLNKPGVVEVIAKKGSIPISEADVKVSDAHKAFQLVFDLLERFNKFTAFSKKHNHRLQKT